MYKSNTIYRSLNPNWDEEFAFLIDDPTSVLRLEVFDYDRFLSDDSMGSCSVELSQLKLFETHEMKLTLEDENGGEDYMGYLVISVTITPLTESQKTDVSFFAPSLPLLLHHHLLLFSSYREPPVE